MPHAHVRVDLQNIFVNLQYVYFSMSWNLRNCAITVFIFVSRKAKENLISSRHKKIFSIGFNKIYPIFSKWTIKVGNYCFMRCSKPVSNNGNFWFLHLKNVIC